MAIMETITTTEFEARCLDILDRLDRHELDGLVVTKQGRPIAVLRPSEDRSVPGHPLHGFLRDSVLLPDAVDLTAPTSDEPFDAAAGRLHR